MNFDRKCGKLACVSAALALVSCSGSLRDSAVFDADGTARITRVIPVLSTLSPEAQPRAFWYHFEVPECHEAVEQMAKFFEGKLLP
jgi:hypothetical protein